MLYRVLAFVVPVGFPSGDVRARQHGGVFAGAVVVQPRRTRTGLAKDLLATRGHRIVRTTGQVTFLETNIAEHAGRDRYVLRLSAMRGYGKRELIIPPG